MFRLLFRFLLLLVFFALIRYALATVTRVFSQMTRPQKSPPPSPQVPKTGLGGELKQDPVCGTFVPVASSIKKTVNGELVHFCSAACRDKYRVA